MIIQINLLPNEQNRELMVCLLFCFLTLPIYSYHPTDYLINLSFLSVHRLASPSLSLHYPIRTSYLSINSLPFSSCSHNLVHPFFPSTQRWPFRYCQSTHPSTPSTSTLSSPSKWPSSLLKTRSCCELRLSYQTTIHVIKINSLCSKPFLSWKLAQSAEEIARKRAEIAAKFASFKNPAAASRPAGLAPLPLPTPLSVPNIDPNLAKKVAEARKTVEELAAKAKNPYLVRYTSHSILIRFYSHWPSDHFPVSSICSCRTHLFWGDERCASFIDGSRLGQLVVIFQFEESLQAHGTQICHCQGRC